MGLSLSLKDSKNVNNEIGKDLQIKKDKEVQKNILALKKCGRAIDNLSDVLYKNLDLPQSRIKRNVAKILNALIPADWMPTTVSDFIAKETHISFFMETHLRENVNNVQSTLKNLIVSAREEEEKLKDLEADIGQMETEKWNAEKIQDYVADVANISLESEINELFDNQSGLLPPKELEKKRILLIERLKANVGGRRNLIEAHGKICSLGLEVLQSGIFQYFDYMSVIRPLRVIETAAKDLVNMDKALFTAKDVVAQMTKLSVISLGIVADATAKVHTYAISSPDTANLFTEVNKVLQEKLKMLDDTREKMLQLETKRREKENVIKFEKKEEKESIKVEDAVFKDVPNAIGKKV